MPFGKPRWALDKHQRIPEFDSPIKKLTIQSRLQNNRRYSRLFALIAEPPQILGHVAIYSDRNFDPPGHYSAPVPLLSHNTQRWG